MKKLGRLYHQKSRASGIKATSEDGEKKPLSAQVQVTYYDPVKNIHLCKAVSINASTTARECISLILDQLEMGRADPSKFQLWIKTGNDETPYPLFRQEYPFSIIAKCGISLQDCTTVKSDIPQNTTWVTRCQFLLRKKQVRKPSFRRLHRPFKRFLSKGDNSDSGSLFGHSLVTLFDREKALPKPVLGMLKQLFLKGPLTEGIFRKSANAREVRELKEKIDRNAENTVDLENVHIRVVASLFKDFLRSLPHCLLYSDFYKEWLEITKITDVSKRISRTFILFSMLHQAHRVLLKMFICVLYQISSRSAENKMSPSNLAVCVGPSMLWSSSPDLALSPEASKKVSAVVEFLIEQCVSMFGEDMSQILGFSPDQDQPQQDRGVDEPDRLQSLHTGAIRKDYSNQDAFEGELSSLTKQDKRSLTYMSRDSGLTMSDYQLYTTDEESEPTSFDQSLADISVGNYNCDSSTISEDESTTYASRSSSRGKEYSSVGLPRKISNLSLESGLSISDFQLYTTDEESESTSYSDVYFSCASTAVTDDESTPRVSRSNSRGKLLRRYNHSNGEKSVSNYSSDSSTLSDNDDDRTPNISRSNSVKMKYSASRRSRIVSNRDADDENAEESDSDSDDDISPTVNEFHCPAELRDISQFDPILGQEVSWSVSQLRVIFGDTVKGPKVVNSPS